MLDALEWVVNKTSFGDARLCARRLVQPTLTKDQNTRGQMARRLRRIHDDDRRIAPAASLLQPVPESLELGRGAVAEIEEMRCWRSRLAVDRDLIEAQAVAGIANRGTARIISEMTDDALVSAHQAGGA